MVNERDRSALRQVCDVYSQRTRSVGPPSEGRCCRLVIERIEMKPFPAIRPSIRQSPRERFVMLITQSWDNAMISPSGKHITLLTEGYHQLRCWDFESLKDPASPWRGEAFEFFTTKMRAHFRRLASSCAEYLTPNLIRSGGGRRRRRRSPLLRWKRRHRVLAETRQRFVAHCELIERRRYRNSRLFRVVFDDPLIGVEVRVPGRRVVLDRILPETDSRQARLTK